MEKKKKSPLSIRIIYWLTTIVFGLFIALSIAVIVFNVLLYTDFFGNNLQLHTRMPVEASFMEIGNLNLNNTKLLN